MALLAQNAQSSGKYITASAKGIRSLANDCPVIVVVDTTSGLSGNSSFNRFARVTPASTSPTDTACSQIAPVFADGNFSRAGNDSPSRSLKLERYLPCRMPWISQYGVNKIAASPIRRL